MKKSDLVSSLHNNGITKGTKLVLHSSYKSINFEGAPEEVCQSFLEAVGDEGLLVMPAHSLNFKNYPKAKGPYNPGRSPSTTGAISDAFRKMPRVARSMHPSHSVAARGTGARELVKDHEKVEPEGKGSPFEKFSQTDGSILMMGCTISALTMMHVAESLAEVPYLKEHFDPTWGYEAEYIDEEDGKVKVYKYNTIPGCSAGFVNAVPWLKEAGFYKELSLNKEISCLMNAKGLIEVVVAKLKQNPYALLTADEDHIRNCHHCKQVQRMSRMV